MAGVDPDFPQKVSPGDIIVADGTGVLCIPLEHVKQVLESSE